jgi:hypothetical protein
MLHRFPKTSVHLHYTETKLYMMPARQAQCSVTAQCICTVTLPCCQHTPHAFCGMSITHHRHWSFNCWENLWHKQKTWHSFCKHFYGSWLQHALFPYTAINFSTTYAMYCSSIQGSPHFQYILLILGIFLCLITAVTPKFPFTLYFLCMSHMVSQYLTLHIQHRINCYCLFF